MFLDMRRFCFALDLKDDENLIQEYKKHHENVWPEIIKSIRAARIEKLDIYIVENRLFMIMETKVSFSFEQKQNLDESNPKVQEWEALMWKYQKALPKAKPGEKWKLMEHIFKL